jgi:hypothetical protein
MYHPRDAGGGNRMDKQDMHMEHVCLQTAG